MHTSIVISALFGAGAIAHPHFKLNNPLAHVHHKRQEPAEIITTTVNGQVEVEEIFVTTVYGPTVTSVNAPEKLAVAPVASTTSPVAAQQNFQVHNKEAEHWNPAPSPTSNTPVAVPVSVTPSVTPSATPVSSSSSSTGSDDGAPKSGGKSILESANHYRNLYGLGSFAYSQTLGANSAKTNNDDGANTMTHELNAGSFAQCIAQVDNNEGAGGLTPFDLTYLGWLCEIPDSRLGDQCQVMLQATNMQINYTDPGHANILKTTSYTQMGCNYLEATQQHANFAGMWTCDFS